MPEKWYDIKEFPNHQISDRKRVRRLSYSIKRKRTYKGQPITPQNGRIHLCIGYSIKTFKINELIEQMFSKEEIGRDEFWKPIEGYEGHYELSNKSNVRSLNRMVEAIKNNGVKILKKNKKGYVSLYDYQEQKQYTRSVEKLYRTNVLGNSNTKNKEHRRKRSLHF